MCVCVCPIISNFGVSDPHSSLASSFGCFPIFLKGSRLKFIFANNSFYLLLVELFGTAGDVVNKHCKQPGPLKDMHSHALNITGARGKGSRILRHFGLQFKIKQYFANFFLPKSNVEEMAGLG